ncbi:hypothetical protein LSH36_27g03022 [Paralvinella palmiformis]|uniref:Fe2OG dioxygenase domain-containing protein n=1 Tax=Paralvinella palmiformis TaxID=53620 RepID=A0AAD9NHL2_9ANNE|nr:hypothetical protein LSH36_27g03022 [Paralvinella palmiformis]
MSTFYRCHCYFSNNYYSKILCGHFVFTGREQFRRKYKKLEDEQSRRYNLDKMSKERRQAIKHQYKPLHHHVYTLKIMATNFCQKLDSHKAFTVQYEPEKDTALDYHFDNAEVTLNVCLGKDFDDGTLYFGNMRTEAVSESHWTEVCHTVTCGILHRGQHLHGAMPIQGGEQVNLIVWLRSSEVRNQLCPMCDSVPDLIEGNGFGDGFTRNCDDI